MAAPKRAAAAPKGAAAATAEAQAEPKRVQFRGIEFTLPDKMPGSLLWDFSDLESTDDATAATMRMLESLLGRDQYLAARRKVVEDKISFDEIEDVIGELMKSIFDVYGLDLGKPSASDAS